MLQLVGEPVVLLGAVPTVDREGRSLSRDHQGLSQKYIYIVFISSKSRECVHRSSILLVDSAM